MRTNKMSFSLAKTLIQTCLLSVVTAIMLNGCNGASNIGSTGTASGNGAGSNDAYFNGVKPDSLTQSVVMDLQWTLDGSTLMSGQNINDMAQHLLTITAVNMPQPLATPIPVNGIQYVFNPTPTDNRGEKVEITDINCKAALELVAPYS